MLSPEKGLWPSFASPFFCSEDVKTKINGKATKVVNTSIGPALALQCAIHVDADGLFPITVNMRLEPQVLEELAMAAKRQNCTIDSLVERFLQQRDGGGKTDGLQAAGLRRNHQRKRGRSAPEPG